MNKKGLTWTTLVTAIIAIIVLILVVYIFKEHLKEIGDKFLSVIKQTGTNAEDFRKGIEEFGKDFTN